MPITEPRATSSQQDRFLQCEEALEAEFQALVWKAIKAGWDEGEACAAIASLADHHILAIDCNNRTSVSIRKLRD
ncbi:hypothetical protein shn_05870 [Shinella sp. HZN7]|nr:hypothetical protein shn_05870 [Shinella sp. HZN7]